MIDLTLVSIFSCLILLQQVYYAFIHLILFIFSDLIKANSKQRKQNAALKKKYDKLVETLLEVFNGDVMDQGGKASVLKCVAPAEVLWSVRISPCLTLQSLSKS